MTAVIPSGRAMGQAGSVRARLATTALTMVLAAGAAGSLMMLRGRSAEPPAPAAPETTPPSAGETARTVSLTAHDNMTYSAPTITASPGELLTVSMRTISSQPREIVHHNFVLLQADAPVDAFVRLAAQTHGPAQHLPAALRHKVIASTDAAGAEETVSTTFRAPVAPGSYVYLCSVPGHFGAGMKGVLSVK